MRYAHHNCASCFYNCNGKVPCRHFENLFEDPEWDERNDEIMIEKGRMEFYDKWLKYVTEYDDDYLLDRAADEEND